MDGTGTTPAGGGRAWGWRPRDAGVPLLYVFLAALLGLVVAGLSGMRTLSAVLALVAFAAILGLMVVPGRAERERMAVATRGPPRPAAGREAGVTGASARPGPASSASEGAAPGASPSRDAQGRGAR